MESCGPSKRETGTPNLAMSGTTRLLHLAAFSLMLLVCGSVALPSQRWLKTYDAPDIDGSLVAAGQAGNGDVILVANIGKQTSGRDIWVQRIDRNGDLVWEKRLDPGADDLLGDAIVTSDDGALVVGWTKNTEEGFAIKVQANGSFGWMTRLPNGSNRLYGVVEAYGGGYVATGRSLGVLFAVQFDAAGSVVWDKQYLEFGRLYTGRAIAKTNDGGYVLGCSRSASEAAIVKLDAGGDAGCSTCLATLYSTSYFIRPDDILPTSDGGYILVGRAEGVSGRPDREAWIMKVSSSGAVDWARTNGFGGNDEAVSAWETSDGGIVTAGYVTTSSGLRSGNLAKFSAAGDLLWEHFIVAEVGLLGNLSRVWEDSTGDLVISAGFATSSPNLGVLGAVHTDAAGFIGSACPLVTEDMLWPQADVPLVLNLTFFTGDLTQAVITDYPSGSSVNPVVQELCSSCPFLTAPLQIAADGQSCTGTITVSDRSPLLSWSDVSGEVGYRWELFSGAACSGSPIASGTTPADTTAAETPVLDGGEYTWRVMALGDGVASCSSDWTCGCTFTVPCLPLSSVALTMVDGQSCGPVRTTAAASPVLTWTDAGAESGYEWDVWLTPQVTSVLSAVADATIKSGSKNKAFGADPFVRVKSGPNRALVRFDQSAIASAVGAGTLVSATLELYIESNSNSWGTTGRTVDIHRLLTPWIEAGVTWNCPFDSNLGNSQPDCSVPWGGGDFVATPTDSVLHTNGLTGWVSYDVTADVSTFLAGTANEGWLVKKTDEAKNGRVDYTSREGTAGQEPRLILLVQPPPASCTGTLTRTGSTPADVTSAEVLPALPDGTFTWRVRPLGDGIVYCDGAWSCGCPFVVGPPAEPTPTGPTALRVVSKGNNAIIVEKVAGATAYNAYMDPIGSWYSPTVGEGTVCTITSWVDNGDGTVTLDLTLPVDSWVVVSTSNSVGESSVGRDSGGTERMSVGSWERCALGP